MFDEHITALPVAATPSADRAEWHVIHAGIELGPLSLTELIHKIFAGEINADDLVKQNGGLWTKAGDLLRRQFLPTVSCKKERAAFENVGDFDGNEIFRKVLLIGGCVLLIAFLAVAFGFVASFSSASLLTDRNREGDMIGVLVAKKTLKMGESLKAPEDLFEIKEFTKGEEPKQAILEAETLKGRILKRSLRTGDFITPDDLLDEKNPVVAYELPQGHQAVGIRVSSETIAGGLASLPHSKVNIISTVRRGDNSKSYSRILLENVLVLAADGNPKIIENGQSMQANVVTVALKPEDVLKLELAKTMGTISLERHSVGRFDGR